MKNDFKTGFIKRAKEYGYDDDQAEFLFKVAGGWGDVMLQQRAEQARGGQPMPGPTPPADTSFHPPVNPIDEYMSKLVANPMTWGGALGGTVGALSGDADEYGNTHRTRNALIGTGLGVGAGALGQKGYEYAQAHPQQMQDWANKAQGMFHQAGQAASGLYDQVKTQGGALVDKLRGGLHI